jgi:predicted nucleic acid-binding Zn ribbon protein
MKSPVVDVRGERDLSRDTRSAPAVATCPPRQEVQPHLVTTGLLQEAHCAHCGTPLVDRRPGTRCCSGKCRAAASLARRTRAAVDRECGERDGATATTATCSIGMVGIDSCALLADPGRAADLPFERIPPLLEALTRLTVLLQERLAGTQAGGAS